MKRAIIVLGSFAILAAAYGVYMYFKKPADVRLEEADYRLSAQELASAYNRDEDSANVKYVDKILIVYGEVSDVVIKGIEGTVFLSSGDPLTSITCSFYSDEVSSLKNVRKGDRVGIKGRCTGKLMDIVMNNCSITTNQ